MRSKKLIILTVTAVVIACSKPVFVQAADFNNNVTTSYATSTIQTETLISKEQAKQIAKDAFKSYFDIILDDSTSNINISSRLGGDIGQNNKSYWDVNFNIDQGNYHNSGFASIDKSSGRIVSLSSFLNNMTENNVKIVAAVTKDQAKAAAEAFISKIAPEEVKAAKLIENKRNDNIRNQGFTFSYCRLNNNIPIYGDYISATVDGFTGKVTSYSIQWTDDLQLPSLDGIIDEKKGKDLVSENTKMDLMYIPSVDTLNPEIERETKLVYFNQYDVSNIIDAKTGEVIEMNKFTGINVKSKDITSEEKEEIYMKSQSSQNLNRAITSDEAEQIAKEKLKLLFNEDFTVNYSGYGERTEANGKRTKTWDISYILKNSNEVNNNGNISINVSNGEIMDIYLFNQFPDNDEEPFVPKLTSEQAYVKAIEIMSKLYPEKIKDINTKQNVEDPSNVTSNYSTQSQLGFNFQRLVNGLAYKHDGINFNFSAKTGELQNLNCSWEDSVSVPIAGTVISAEEAKKVFLLNNMPRLMYMKANNNSSSNNEKEIKLVYSTNNMYYDYYTYIDANTGKLLNNYGQEVDDCLIDFQNAIKGSSVEKEANILVSNGIIDTRDFKLNGNITNLQFIKILTSVKNFDRYYGNSNNIDLKISTTIAKDSADYKYLQLAVNAGIIDNSGEFNPSTLVTREQASVYLIKLLHFDRIGKLKDAFAFQPADKDSISTDFIGYVSLAKDLGLISTDSNNKIRPKDNITMEELIKAIYNTLQ
ncbi:MAG: YcdB/YcdC domain-containing protein [Solirubrobacterales bacterium]